MERLARSFDVQNVAETIGDDASTYIDCKVGSAVRDIAVSHVGVV